VIVSEILVDGIPHAFSPNRIRRSTGFDQE
jgi:hypothetical protein